jgi:hypothetical protein
MSNKPPIQWVSAAHSARVKRPGREADHLPSSSAEVGNAWSCTSTHPYVFMAWCFVRYRIHLHGVVPSSAEGQLYLYLCKIHRTISLPYTYGEQIPQIKYAFIFFTYEARGIFWDRSLLTHFNKSIIAFFR